MNSELLKLNRVSDIITQKQAVIIPATILETAIKMQYKKTEILINEKSDMVDYALIMLRVLVLVRYGVCAEDDIFKRYRADMLPELTSIANNVYKNYMEILPPREYWMVEDLSMQEFNYIQKAVSGNIEACMVVSIFFAERGNQAAASYWMNIVEAHSTQAITPSEEEFAETSPIPDLDDKLENPKESADISSESDVAEHEHYETENLKLTENNLPKHHEIKAKFFNESFNGILCVLFAAAVLQFISKGILLIK
jgi:hypothetical protein